MKTYLLIYTTVVNYIMINYKYNTILQILIIEFYKVHD